MPSIPEQTEQQQIQALFASCERREKNLRKDDIDQVRHKISKAVNFGPIFEPVPQVANETDELILAGAKHRKLIDLLKRAPDPGTRWILLARWLRQEKVCEPEDFLPEEAKLDSLLNRPWKGTRRDDPVHITLVEIWLPYFEKLFEDKDDLKRRKVSRVLEELINKGYDGHAAGIAFKKRSAVEAVYSWLHRRNRVSAETFRNAYSRIRASIKRLPPDEVERIYAKEIIDLAQQGQTSGILTGRRSSGKRDADK